MLRGSLCVRGARFLESPACQPIVAFGGEGSATGAGPSGADDGVYRAAGTSSVQEVFIAIRVVQRAIGVVDWEWIAGCRLVDAR